jgi:hypothetical protein
VSYRPRPKARDASEPNIVAALEAIGASVERIDSDKRKGVLDLVVGFRGRDRWLEVKNPPSTRTRRRKNGDATLGYAPETDPTPEQVRWMAGWKGARPVVVRTPAEAIAAVMAPAPDLIDVVRAQAAALPRPEEIVSSHTQREGGGESDAPGTTQAAHADPQEGTP